MKKINLKAVLGWLVMILIGTMAAAGAFRSESSKNAEAFEKKIREKCTDYISISLNELTPFEWDKMYSFPPYMSKEQMYEIMGFESDKVHETFSEGINSIVFTQGDKVVCSIVTGRNEPFSLGGKMEFSSGENPIFVVTRTGREDDSGGRIWLYWCDSGAAVKALNASAEPEMAGVWKCEDIKEQGDVTVKRGAAFVVSKDGLVIGHIGRREYRGGTEIQNLETAQYIDYKGHLSGKTAKCRLESKSDKSVDEEFELNFENGMFSGNIELTGEEEALSGHYEFKKR